MAQTFEKELVAIEAISTPPSPFDIFIDRSFRGLTFVFAGLTAVLVLYILWEIGGKAAPAVREYGLLILTSSQNRA